MPAIFFDKFGGNKGGFSGIEQGQLKQAVQDAIDVSAKAKAAAASGFMGHRDKLALWFGSSGPAAIKTVTAGLDKMHKVLTDANRSITFVDARNQNEKLLSFQTQPAPGAAGRQSHGATVMKLTHTDTVPMGTGDYAYVKCLSDHNQNANTVAHVGSGMRVYMGERGFHNSKTLKDRTITVYHELTHKTLGTVDYDVTGQLVYGVNACKQLAARDSKQALLHADCWSYFVASFKYAL